MHLLFASGGQSIGVLVSVLPWILRVDFLQDWLVWSPSYPRGTEETFPTPISKASILQCSDFFIVQLSHPYMTTRKNIALTRWTFVGKVMSLLFNMLSGLSLLLPRSKHLLISWLQSASEVFLDPGKIKSYHCFHCFPFYLPWSDGTGCHDLSFLNAEF